MGDSVKKYFTDMSDREIMNAKKGKKSPKSPTHKKLPPNLNSTPIEVFEQNTQNYLMNLKNTKEMYEMFARKHMDYGLNNIALGGDIVNNSDDKQFSLTGLCIRLTDKISRLKNLLINGKSFVEGEGIQDTFIDIANYGIIGLLVGRDKWKK